MRYFALHLTRPDGTTLFETDFLAEQFAPFVHDLVLLLIERKLLQPEEPYSARLIPRIDNSPHFDKPTLLQASDLQGNGKARLDIRFEGITPPLDKITYLTIEIIGKESHMLVRFDMKLDTLLYALLSGAAQVVLDSDLLAEGEHFRFHVSAHDKDRPRVDPVAINKEETEEPVVKPKIVIGKKEALARAANPQAVALPAHATVQDDLDIVVGPVEALIKPDSHSMKDFAGMEMVGEVSPQDLPILVRRGALEQARVYASAKADEEVGGFLLGNVFRDPESDRLFVDISDVAQADRTRGTFVSLNFDYEAWRQVPDRLEHDFPGKSLLGWYHTHLVSHAVVVPVQGIENEYMAGYIPFFSHPDLFIHQNFFPDPWHVALVLDLRCHSEAFFAWKASTIEATHGYYLYGE